MNADPLRNPWRRYKKKSKSRNPFFRFTLFSPLAIRRALARLYIPLSLTSFNIFSTNAQKNRRIILEYLFQQKVQI